MLAFVSAIRLCLALAGLGYLFVGGMKPTKQSPMHKKIPRLVSSYSPILTTALPKL